MLGELKSKTIKKVPRELTWKLIFHVPIYLYMFWVAYTKVRKGIKAARESRMMKKKPIEAVNNPNWQWESENIIFKPADRT